MQKRMGSIIAKAEGIIISKTAAANAVVGVTPSLIDHESIVENGMGATLPCWIFSVSDKYLTLMWRQMDVGYDGGRRWEVH